MSQATGHMPETSIRIDTGSEHLIEQSILHRHILPHSTRFSTVTKRGNISRISKVDHYRNAFLHRRQTGSRGTFHRVISSFFGGNEERAAHSASPQSRSRASSFGSRPGSSIQGSVPSLDLVSPGAFLFSGPSLQSAGSHNNSISRLPSLTESFDNTYIHHGVHTESFSTVEHTSVDDDSLESVVGLGGMGRMSDILPEVKISVEESSDPRTEGPDNKTSLDKIPIKCDDPLCKLPLPSTAEEAVQNSSITLNNSSNDLTSSTTRPVHDNMDAVALPPPSGTLPTEILQTIYSNLNARDFNAARRTCRRWMAASLSKSLLIAMLTRGGWIGDSAFTRMDAVSRETTEQQNTQKLPTNSSSEAWDISRYLSRQCALASQWTGNGLDVRPAIVESTEIDFSDLAAGYATQQERASGVVTFTASVCGRYLLVVKHTLIYIYSMSDGLLQPLTSVVCPRRVLSVSMNTSLGRDAVAALLEGRMGMVCELRLGRPSLEPASGDTCVEGDGYPPRTGDPPTMPVGDTSDLQYAIDSAEQTSPRVLRSPPYVRRPALDAFDAIELKAHNQGFNLRGTDDPSTHDQNLINQEWNLDLRGPPKNPRMKPGATLLAQNIPIESGTSTFYRHLCSEDDPPRNVSICPQRRCVAFGCSTGIELHWIDALTGQSLSRWFPVTSPSDYLYFMSPRPGFESAKKLRLISSAAHPDDRPALNRKFFPNSIANSIWDSFGFESHQRQSQGGDHLQAVPLSDGHHVLFVDPSTERLSLGCDAPLGGPAKLLRKIVFEPPEDIDNRRQSRRFDGESGSTQLQRRVPRIYTAAADLSSGARIVVAYGEIIMMYSIPPDVLALSRIEQANESRELYSEPPFSPTGRHPDHWLNWWDEPMASQSKSDSDSDIWPICLFGTEIGRLPDICELAIQTLPEMTIWAFTHSEQCRTWRLRNYADPVVRTRQYIDRSGVVHGSDFHTVDTDKNVGIRDAPPSQVSVALDVEGKEWETPGAERSVVVGIDGSASGVLKRVPGALALDRDGWVDGIDVSGSKDAWFEGDGDVVSWWEV